MKKSTYSMRACILVAVLAMTFSTRGQQPSSTIRVKVHLVEVYASVFDHRGQYVEGLGRDNFQVFEDGKPQQISIFEADTGKLSCAILLDTTGSMA